MFDHEQIDKIYALGFQNEQRFLVCSDGLYNYCTEKRVKRNMGNIRSERTLQKTADQMLRKVYEEGAGDNVSLILNQILENERLRQC